MIITSLAPSHKNKENQLKAIESWKKQDKKVVSVNHISEIRELEKEYDVEFVQPKRTGMQLFGRHYVPASELIKVIKKEGAGLIINSDIIIKDLPIFGDSPVIFNRYDFTDSMEKSTMFKSGFDSFFLTEEHCVIPETLLCLGQCHWDYWLPIMLLNHGFKLQRPVKQHIFHKKHDLQYDRESWKRTSKIFSIETGMRGSDESISNKAFQVINSQIIDI